MTAGNFRRNAQGQLIVTVRDRRFVQRALCPYARVGDVPVVGIMAANGELKGIVRGRPAPGAEVIVQYPPEPEIRTGVRYGRRRRRIPMV